MDKFDIKIKEGMRRGDYYLMISHGDHWSGLIIKNAEQMRQISDALIAKTKEIKKENSNG
jgi:hypothetical protein